MALVKQSGVTPKGSEKLRQTRLKDGHLLIVRKSLVGDKIRPETIDPVTQSEVAAGRMTPGDDLCKAAVPAVAAPYLSRPELIAMDANKRTEATARPLSAWGRALAWLYRGW